MSFSQLELEGKSVQSVFDEITKVGVSSVDASILISSWIFENFGKSKRVFNYQQAFPAADPACVARFNRTFQHADWVDGESMVQAQQTPGEDGFNARFHRIESDLDAVKSDLVQSFACLAAMRAGMRVLLDECLPRRLGRELTGHAVTTVPQAGWAGARCCMSLLEARRHSAMHWKHRHNPDLNLVDHQQYKG